MKLRVLNDKGESLVTVLTSVAIVSVLIAGTTTHMNQVMNTTQYLSAAMEASGWRDEVKTIISATNACALNFAGKQLPSGEERQSINSLRYADATGTALAADSVLDTSKKIAYGLQFKSASIFTKRIITPNQYLADLELYFDNPRSNVTLIRRTIPLTVTVDAANKIVDCRAVGGASGGTMGSAGKCPSKTTRIGEGAIHGRPFLDWNLPEAILTYSIQRPDPYDSVCTYVAQCQATSAETIEWRVSRNCQAPPEPGSGAF